MKHIFLRRTGICFLLMLMIVFSHKAYSAQSQGKSAKPQSDITGPDISHFLVAVEDEPDTVDFQCTSIHYTIAQNVFNRLVETENDANGMMEIVPSLAKSWEVSEDGRTYTDVFPLDREGRRQELARLHGGENITETTLLSAEEQLEGCERFKAEIGVKA